MRITIPIVLSLALFSGVASSQEEDYAPNQVLVSFNPTSPAAFTRIGEEIQCLYPGLFSRLQELSMESVVQGYHGQVLFSL